MNKVTDRCYERRHMTPQEYGIYCYIRQVSHKTKIFYLDGRRLAEEFRGTSRSAIYRVLDRLKAAGWIEEIRVPKRLKNGMFANGQYRALSHDEWHHRHPESCQLSSTNERGTVPTSGTGKVVASPNSGTGTSPIYGIDQSHIRDSPVPYTGLTSPTSGTKVCKEVFVGRESKERIETSSAARLLGAGSFSSNPSPKNQKPPAENVPGETVSGKRTVTDAELAEGFQAWVDEGHPEKTFHEYRPSEHELEWAAFKKRRLALARKYLTWVVDRFSDLRLQSHLRPQFMALFLKLQASDAELSVGGSQYSLLQFATQQELTLVDEYNDFTAGSLLGTLGERLASIRTEFKRQQANKALGDRLTAEARAKVVRETEERRAAEEAESLEDDDDPFADIDSRHAVTV